MLAVLVLLEPESKDFDGLSLDSADAFASNLEAKFFVFDTEAF